MCVCRRVPFAALLPLVRRRHTNIAHCFGSDMGVRLMRLDSQIALDVLYHFARRGVPCLGIEPAANVAASLRDSEFFRLPKPGTRNPLSGLSRTSIIEHGQDEDFKLIRLRKRGSRRGIVLVETKSFLQWLHSLPGVTKE